MATEKPVFSKEAEDLIFDTARAQVLSTVLWHGRDRTDPDFHKKLGPWAETPVLGTFVSFKKNDQLRSCMGWMSDGVSLAEALKASATSAAREDPRFPPLAASEFESLSMEVWVLWGMEETTVAPEERINAFQIGRHGLQISGGGRRGLLLPGVATEFGMGPQEFLEAVCNKAGLPRDAWRDERTTLYIFEGLAIDRPFFDASVAAERAEALEKRKGKEARFDPRSFAWNFGRLTVPSRTPAPPNPEFPQVRPAAVAGMFYPRGEEQRRMLERFAASATEEPCTDTTAVMVPHAGWIYSGELAYRTLAEARIPSSVLILAPKHRPEGKPWGLSPSRIWEFGDGQLENDMELTEGIARAVPRFQLDAESHRREHAIEVILPFLAQLAPKVKVAGALLGYGNETDLFEGAKQFADYYQTLENPPLLIISSDMNHYESEERTRELDAMALNALETLDARRLCRTVSENRISMCGVHPAAFVLETLRLCGRLHSCRQIGYATSGKVSGDYRQVVGYAGYLFF
jgi:AmmeMemoRadiSam system protein B/AmmeMemoRadiSam system protein A